MSRIYAPTPMPERAIIDRYTRLASSLVSDVFDRWSGTGILPISGYQSGQVVVGPALTVRTRPGDNLAVHKALDLARPGEVLVVDAGGGVDRAILGGLMGYYASRRGIAALVVDGAVRDRSDLECKAPPIWARGICQLGPYKDGPGDLRCPVSIGGLAIHDGDLIIADEDGITSVPRGRTEELLPLAEAKAKDEQEQFAAIEADAWDRSWVDPAMQPDEVH